MKAKNIITLSIIVFFSIFFVPQASANIAHIDTDLSHPADYRQFPVGQSYQISSHAWSPSGIATIYVYESINGAPAQQIGVKNCNGITDCYSSPISLVKNNPGRYLYITFAYTVYNVLVTDDILVNITSCNEPDNDCDGIDDDNDGQIDEHFVPIACGSGSCTGTKSCVNGQLSQCSSANNDCGTCCKCSTTGVPSYDSLQDNDCSSTNCPADGCGVGGCSVHIFGDYPTNVQNECVSLNQCSNNQCSASCTGDNDGDGYSSNCGDCNDNNPNIHTGVTEQCNGIDDDCDEQVDEGCECTNGQTRTCGSANCAGTQTCTNGNWGTCSTVNQDCGVCCKCSATSIPSYDSLQDADCSLTTCPSDACGAGGCGLHIFGDYPLNVQNECTGLFSCTQRTCTASCQGDTDHDGYSSNCGDCNDNNAAIKPGATEVCNGVDDNCNNIVDEGCECVNGEVGVCGTGVCSGTRICTSGHWGVCSRANTDCGVCCRCSVSSAPAFDPYQNSDCSPTVCGTDGCGVGGCGQHIFGDFPISVNNVCSAIGQCTQNQCNAVCENDRDSDSWSNSCGDCNDYAATRYPGAPELCNGVDDNCNGQVDEGCECTNGQYRACGSGSCSGTQTCANGHWGSCSSSNNICNTLDCDYLDTSCRNYQDQYNRCDGQGSCVMNATCSVYSNMVSGTSCGASTYEFGCPWGSSLDSDTGKRATSQTCNGLGSCLSSTGSWQIDEYCTLTQYCYWDGNGPNDENYYCRSNCTAEVCDGIDNDCDGQIDEYLSMACGSGSCSGTKTCSNGVWGSCSTSNNDCGTCCKCSTSGVPSYDSFQNNDCSTTSCPSDGCGVGGCGLHIFGDYPINVANQCSSLYQCTQNSCSASCSGDNDNDGYSAGCGDCNDNNENVHTGVIEQCNGYDDDCDSQVDEGCECVSGAIRTCGSGSCAGQQTCVSGHWSTCSSANNDCGTCCKCTTTGSPSYDSLQDNDCSLTTCPNDACGAGGCGLHIFGDFPVNVQNECIGLFSCSQRSCSAQCQADGDSDSYSSNCGDCNDNSAVIRPNAAEVCNGVDDNCNNIIDEGCECVNGEIGVCGTGVCEGTRICTNGHWGVCSKSNTDCGVCCRCSASSAPAFDPYQNSDCTPTVCGTDGCGVGGCGTHIFGDFPISVNNICSAIGQCSQNQCSAICQADRDSDTWSNSCGDCNDYAATRYPGAPELCNGVDDNCNGQVDEGCECTNGQSRTCGSGNCAGSQSCVNGHWNTCSSSGNVCGTLDCDYLDTSCRNYFDQNNYCSSQGVCVPNSSCTIYQNAASGTSCGLNSYEYGCPWGNLLDSDTGRRTTTQTCNGQGSCLSSTGSWQIDEYCTLTQYCYWDGNGQSDEDYYCRSNCSAEICDGIDNDCDGQVDESLSIQCGSGNCAGIKTCTSGAWSTCSTANNDCGTCCTCSANGVPSYDFLQDNDCSSVSCPPDGCGVGGCGLHIFGDYTLSTQNECVALGQCSTNQCSVTCEIDGDGDGYSSNCGDCNDQSSSIKPGVTEICNGIDDNCNNIVDEGCECVNGEVGVCGTGACEGTRTCNNGHWSICSKANTDCGICCRCSASSAPAYDPYQNSDCTPTVCGTDGCGVGGCAEHIFGDFPISVNNVCTAIGQCTQNQCTAVCENDRDFDSWSNSCGDCNDYAATRYPGAPEICNGLDDNCNGLIDDNCSCFSGQTKSCGSSGCAGTSICTNGEWGSCSTLNRACKTASCGDSDIQCTMPFQVQGLCSEKGICEQPLPSEDLPIIMQKSLAFIEEECEEVCTAEICDNHDNDCDGSIDEGCDDDNDNYCDADMQVVYFPNTCTHGGNDCVDTDQNIYPNKQEICNGVDDNCDGVIDEGCECVNGEVGVCGAGVCEGTRTCTNGHWSICSKSNTDCGVCCRCSASSAPAFDPYQNSDCTPTVCGTDGCGVGNCGEHIFGDFPISVNNMCVGIHQCTLNECTSVCENDRDSDSWSTSCEDCNDYSATRHPEATEICNGVDDDCDGTVDEGCECINGQTRACGSGLCSGSQTCVSGQWNDCSSDGNQCSTLDCDYLDTSCRNYVDQNNYCNAEGACVIDATCFVYTNLPSGATCGSSQFEYGCPFGTSLDSDTGIRQITNSCDGLGACDSITGMWQADEVCNQYEYCYWDDSGQNDEDYFCNNNCTAEVCDGVDNDCDGQVDESLSMQCGSGSCSGAKTCSNGVWSDCSTQNNDCGICCECNVDGTPFYDSLQDNDCSPTTCSGDGCGVGSCGLHIFGDYPLNVENQCSHIYQCTQNTCSVSCEIDADNDGYGVSCGDCNDLNLNIHPGATESCNGIDDDCDGTIDENCECIDGETQNCGLSDIGECGFGVETCNNGLWEDCTALSPQTEICDGLDNDCDGQIDEGCFCVNGETMQCGTDVGECEFGSKTCINGEWTDCVGGVDPAVELCNTLDDDCDGKTDDGGVCPYPVYKYEPKEGDGNIILRVRGDDKVKPCYSLTSIISLENNDLSDLKNVKIDASVVEFDEFKEFPTINRLRSSTVFSTLYVLKVPCDAKDGYYYMKVSAKGKDFIRTEYKEFVVQGEKVDCESCGIGTNQEMLVQNLPFWTSSSVPNEKKAEKKGFWENLFGW